MLEGHHQQQKKQMYTGKGTEDSLVACGDASSWATLRQCAGLMKERQESFPEDAQPCQMGIRGVQIPADGKPRSPGWTRAPRNLLLERY